MTRKQNGSPATTTILPEFAGKIVQRIYQDSGDFHSLDGGYEQDGPVTIEFTDGTTLMVVGSWCNDDTASTGWVTGTWIVIGANKESE